MLLQKQSAVMLHASRGSQNRHKYLEPSFLLSTSDDLDSQRLAQIFIDKELSSTMVPWCEIYCLFSSHGSSARSRHQGSLVELDETQRS